MSTDSFRSAPINGDVSSVTPTGHRRFIGTELRPIADTRATVIVAMSARKILDEFTDKRFIILEEFDWDPSGQGSVAAGFRKKVAKCINAHVVFLSVRMS